MRDIRIKKPKLSKIPKLNLLTVYLYFICFLIIFSSGAILDEKYFNISQLVLIVACIPFIFLLKGINRNAFTLFVCVVPIYILINLFTSSETIINYLLYWIKFFMLFIFVNYIVQEKTDLFMIMYKIIIVLCLYSVATYLFFDIYHAVPYSVEEINGKIYKVYLGIHYHGQDVLWFSGWVARNNSIFWEPGVFQIYIGFALFYQLFINKKIKISHLTILFISMYTTYSTTGFILTLSLLFLWTMKGKPKNVFSALWRIVILPTMFICGLVVGSNIYEQKVNNGTESYDLRQQDLNAGYETFKEKPLVGWGFLNNTGYEAKTGEITNSNGFISMLFQLGFLGFLFHCVPVLVFIFKSKRVVGYVGLIAFGLFYYLSVSSEPLLYSNFFNMILCLGFLGMIEGGSFKSWQDKTISRHLCLKSM